MGHIKHIIAFITLLLLCSCEFDPLDFIRTTYDVDKRCADSMEYNQQKPQPNQTSPTNDYSFIIASDAHIHDSEAMMPDFFATAELSPALFVLINGDIYNSKSEFAQYAHNLFRQFTQKPCYFVAGNHDMYFDWKLYLDFFGSSTYSFSVQTPGGTDLFIALESGSGTLGKTQLNWLKEQLDQRNHYRYCFVITHTNFVVQGVNNGSYPPEEREYLFRLFADARITGILTGHSHISNQQNILQVPYWTTGALKNREYGIVSVNNDSCHIEFKKL